MCFFRTYQLGWAVASYLLLTSFFWTDEQKEIATLAAAGQEAILEKDYTLAQQHYRALLKQAWPSDQPSTFLSWPEIIDYSMRLAYACEQLGDTKEALDVLGRLLDHHPPPSLSPKILLMQTRLSAPQSSPEKAYQILRGIAEVLPIEMWSKEDLSFFHLLSSSLDDYFEAQLHRAKRYYVTGFFQEAAQLYQAVLSGIENHSFPKALLHGHLIEKKVRYALAECHYSMADYEKSLALIQNPSPEEGKIDREMLYLMALCYKHKQDYETAMQCLEQYTHTPHKEQLSHYDHALFELGFFYYTHAQESQARHYFQLLQYVHDFSRPKILATLYLTRLDLKEGHLQEARTRLSTLSKTLSSEDPIRQELYFLEGETYYLLEDFEQARKAYELALPGSLETVWGQHARIQLGRCYLKLASNPVLPLTFKSMLFERAEAIFQALLEMPDPISSALSLAKLYILKKEHLADPEALLHVEPLLTKHVHKMSCAQQHEALLLLAESCVDGRQRQELLIRATSTEFALLASYPDAWYALGLCRFQLGIDTQKQSYFDDAVTAFEQAFHLCAQDNNKLAAQVLRWEAKANFYRSSPLAALHLLEQLLVQFPQTEQEREETWYLRGLIASGLKGGHHFELAQTSLQHVIENYPQGTYSTEALRILGTLYFQKEDFQSAYTTFIQLATHYPQAPQAADGLFWAAEALAHLDPQDPHIAFLRQELCFRYPHCEKAAEAYFRLYSYEAYLEGQSDALAHLQTFSIRFPHSSLRVIAQYLLGLHITIPEEAMIAFEDVLKLFAKLSEEGTLPTATMVHFYYEAMHKLALLYLQRSYLTEKGLALLHRILDDFAEPMHPLTTALKQQTPVPEEYAQCAYSLAKAYLDLRQRIKAEQQFFGLLTCYRQAGIHEGFYLALSWREQAILAMQDHDYEIAFNCLDIAEEAGRLSFTDEQKLKIWLLKSDCSRNQGDYEKAMRYLSKVINTDVASPLRLQAMLLRAEIYELQERPELAVRQLEALAKKGGEWAQQAHLHLHRLTNMQ